MLTTLVVVLTEVESEQCVCDIGPVFPQQINLPLI